MWYRLLQRHRHITRIEFTRCHPAGLKPFIGALGIDYQDLVPDADEAIALPKLHTLIFDQGSCCNDFAVQYSLGSVLREMYQYGSPVGIVRFHRNSGVSEVVVASLLQRAQIGGFKKWTMILWEFRASDDRSREEDYGKEKVLWAEHGVQLDAS